LKLADQTSEHLRETVLFLTRLLIFSSPILVFVFWGQFLLFPLRSAVSSLIFHLTEISGLPVSLSTPTTLSLLCENGEQVLLSVEWQCIGILSMSLFLALVMATPSIAFKEKVKVLIIGEPTLFFLNLLRIYVTALCGYYYGVQTMLFIHKVMWEALMPLIAIAAWLTWLYSLRLHGLKNEKVNLD